jgi:acetate kinase
MMVDAILVLNAGSSSIKFGLFAVSGTEPHLLCKGLFDEHQAKPGFTVTDAADKYLYEKRRVPAEALLADILYWSSSYLAGAAGARHHSRQMQSSLRWRYRRGTPVRSLFLGRVG